MYLIVQLYLFRIDEQDLGKLFKERQQLGREDTRITLKFMVEGRGAGTYSAVVSNIGDGDRFYLDAVYRQRDQGNSARIDIALPEL